MLQWVTYPEVKANADVVTNSVDKGGISKVVSVYIEWTLVYIIIHKPVTISMNIMRCGVFKPALMFSARSGVIPLTRISSTLASLMPLPSQNAQEGLLSLGPTGMLSRGIKAFLTAYCDGSNCESMLPRTRCSNCSAWLFCNTIGVGELVCISSFSSARLINDIFIAISPAPPQELS